jgi:hypothetical protein
MEALDNMSVLSGESAFSPAKRRAVMKRRDTPFDIPHNVNGFVRHLYRKQFKLTTNEITQRFKQ